MIRIGPMAKRIILTNRRAVLSGLGLSALVPALPRRGLAVPAPKAVSLRATATRIGLRTGQPETPIWSLEGPTPGLPLRFNRGDEVEISLQNDLPAPVALSLRGLDGNAAAEPLTAHPPVGSGARTTLNVSLRQAGSFLCDIRLLADGVSAARSLMLVVEGAGIVADRDEVLLFEDWRTRPDGTLVAPGSDPDNAEPLLTLNGRIMPDIAVRSGERLRLRFVNGCQRQVIAVKVGGFDLRVMALDGQPSEPFLARNGALVLAPGGRADALIDATGAPGTSSAVLLHDGKTVRPAARLVTSTEPPVPSRPPPAALPSNGLPTQLDLRNALRMELPLSGSEWALPATFAPSVPPAFRVKKGRVVVLAVTNPGAIATVFHPHGHHVRLLDRLDDGWKPYWLDTLAVEPGQTQRVAFLAEYAGRYLLESTAADWASPRLVRWYAVE
jgi:FtsP/CotA-like multicopper oxidase with cupredoxin domain